MESAICLDTIVFFNYIWFHFILGGLNYYVLEHKYNLIIVLILYCKTLLLLSEHVSVAVCCSLFRFVCMRSAQSLMAKANDPLTLTGRPKVFEEIAGQVSYCGIDAEAVQFIACE